MRREGTVTVLRAGVTDDAIVTLRRLVVAGGGTAGTAASLRCLERLSCSRLRFEQPAPYVEERPTDEHGSPEQDESGNDGHRQRDDRNHLELDQVVPTGGPLRQERSVLALHDLEAAPEVLRH